MKRGKKRMQCEECGKEMGEYNIYDGKHCRKCYGNLLLAELKHLEELRMSLRIRNRK